MNNCNCKDQGIDIVREMTVICSTNERRGKGKDMSDPVRIITSYWCIHGTLLAEIDPCDKSSKDVMPENYLPVTRESAQSKW